MSIIHFPADADSAPSLFTKRLLAESQIESPKSFESQLQERRKIQKQISEKRQAQEEQKIAVGQKSSALVTENNFSLNPSDLAKSNSVKQEEVVKTPPTFNAALNNPSALSSLLKAPEKNSSELNSIPINASELLAQFQLSSKPIIASTQKETQESVMTEIKASNTTSNEAVSAAPVRSENINSPIKESPVLQLRLPIPVPSPEWQQAISQQMAWIAHNQMTAAEIHLNPPELGPLSARLKLLADKKVHIVFMSDHQSVRSALMDSLPHLNDLFSSQGLFLDKVEIPDQGDDQLAQSFAEFAGDSKNKISGSAYSIHQLNRLLDDYA